MPKQMTVQQAMDLLDGEEEWKRFQVSYPEARRGAFEIQKFHIPKGDPKSARIVAQEGMDRYTGWGDFTKLIEHVLDKDGQPDTRVWMSDTRAEILEHSPFFNKLFWLEPFGDRKRVLVNGLGLGLAVHGASTYRGIAHIDVVESDPDVAGLVAPYLPENVTVHVGDAYSIRWPAGTHWDLAWHDIWPTISDENLPGMDKLIRKYKGKVGWQGCWQRKGCIKMKRILDQAKAGTLDPQLAYDFLNGTFIL